MVLVGYRIPRPRLARFAKEGWPAGGTGAGDGVSVVAGWLGCSSRDSKHLAMRRVPPLWRIATGEKDPACYGA